MAQAYASHGRKFNEPLSKRGTHRQPVDGKAMARELSSDLQCRFPMADQSYGDWVKSSGQMQDGAAVETMHLVSDKLRERCVPGRDTPFKGTRASANTSGPDFMPELLAPEEIAGS
jgi:hypothetical protein